MKDILSRIIWTSLINLFQAQPNLSDFIPEVTSEREPNLSFHFANELWKYLFWLDCDFDITKLSHENKRPDIIFHKRGSNALNFLVVEVKRKGNASGFADDLEKIKNHWFGNDLDYQFGASVVIDENTGDFEIRLLDRKTPQSGILLIKGDFINRLSPPEFHSGARKLIQTKTVSLLVAEKAGTDTAGPNEDLNTWICRMYAREWSIDDIVIGTSARQWLEKNNLLPSSWVLSKEETEKIKQAGIRLTIMYSPGSILTLQPNPLKDCDTAKVIIFDADSFGLGSESKLNVEETIATFLHEIGHVFYEPAPQISAADALSTARYVQTTNGKEDEENAADDYAFQFGYGKHIASGLEKLAKIHPDTFGTDEVKVRIERMKGRAE